MWLHLHSKSKKFNKGDLVINLDKIKYIDLIIMEIDGNKIYGVIYNLLKTEKLGESFDTEQEARDRLAEVLKLLHVPSASDVANNFDIEGIYNHKNNLEIVKELFRELRK